MTWTQSPGRITIALCGVLKGGIFNVYGDQVGRVL